MTYERYGMRDAPHDERSRDERFREQRGWERGRGGPEERGFFERAGDEIASWFGDEEAERRRRYDEMMHRRELGRDYDLGRGEPYRPFPSGRSAREPGPPRPPESWSERQRTYRDYEPGRAFDPRYHAWRQRHLSELDRDYEEYRREHQAEFERDFSTWRERRAYKRRLLDDIREHMEVVGSDDQHVGTIDRVAGDRIVLTRSDPESGGVHHSLSCSDVDRVEGDRVVLESSAEQAKQRWRDEDRERALFEREDQGEIGPRNLGRSFAGTYR